MLRLCTADAMILHRLREKSRSRDSVIVYGKYLSVACGNSSLIYISSSGFICQWRLAGTDKSQRSRVTASPCMCVCAQQILRSACTFKQSDQSIRKVNTGKQRIQRALGGQRG